MRFELWTSSSGDLYLRRDGTNEEQIKAITSDAKLIWTYEAKSYFEAMQAYYDHMEWGIYKPEPSWEDEIYDS